MKKLFGCLIAIAMVLGFVSCSKDAEPAAATGWQEKRVYIAWTEGWDLLGAYDSEEDAIASNAGHIESYIAYYIANTSITKLNKVTDDDYNTWTEGQNFTTNGYDEIEVRSNDYVLLGSAEGYIVVVPENSDYKFQKPEEISETRKFYFDDGTVLTLYIPGGELVR